MEEKLEWIIVADDQPIIVTVLRRNLKGQFPGVQLVPARDGRVAQDLIRKRIGIQRGLVVSDNSMPEIWGQDLAEEFGGQVPFVLMSGSPLEEDVGRGLRQKGVQFLGKPFNPEELFEAIGLARAFVQDA